MTLETYNLAFAQEATHCMQTGKQLTRGLYVYRVVRVEQYPIKQYPAGRWTVTLEWISNL